jgi:hypothetical protein
LLFWRLAPRRETGRDAGARQEESMSQVSDAGLEKLTFLLPLPARHAALAPELQHIHEVFLRSLVERGRPLSMDEIAELAPGGDALNAVWTLAAHDLIVLDAGRQPVGAYPVTVEQTPFRVHVKGNDIRAMCAFDAVSVAPMFETEVVIDARCPVTGEAIHVEQQDRKILNVLPSPDARVGIWWRTPGPVAARTLCAGITFLRDPAAGETWRALDPDNRDVVSLEDAIDAGGRFFKPLLETAAVPQLAGTRG